MKSSNNKDLRLKTILNLIRIGLAIAFLILLFVFKGSMNTMLTQKMRDQASGELKMRVDDYIDSSFDYTRNNQLYKITFLEFGASGCIACRKMEKVMEEVNEHYSGKIKVHFINVLLPASQEMMKYFGIAVIPTQVLLDSSGKEVFRHTGYFSFNDLEHEFRKIN